jgi:hypothetical protein
MNLIKKLEEIEEHFKNITAEEFEEGLKRSGEGYIEHSSESGYEMIE